jgi:D-alanyl-D-alanine carboxypeptidase
VRRLLLLAAACIVLAAGCGGASTRSRPALQRTLDELVRGPDRIAPGATAFVSGPHGTWTGSAGWADEQLSVRMRPDARMRLESVSKLWTATVVLKLASQGKLGLDDTVERWLPGLFPDGGRITIRELLNHTSGLIDNNDISARPEYWLSRIADPKLRARLVKLAADLAADPDTVFPTMLEIRAAAALPLLSEPGTQWHYSNIGYQTVGVIAAKAGGAPLAELYDRFIIRPLGLTSAAYAPGGPIPGPHPVGYAVLPGGKAVPASDWGAGGLGAEGGIVADARDEAAFLVALMRGELLPAAELDALETPAVTSPGYGLGTGVGQTCAGQTFTHNGGGASWASSVAVTADGDRVAVLLLNGRRTDDAASDYYAALIKLFCSA